MLIATFGPTTAWQGMRITWSDGQFTLEDHGPIGADGVMQYDREGHLIWADEGTRAWVGSLAVRLPGPAQADEPHARLKRILFAAIVVLIVLNVVLVVLIISHAVHL